MHLDGNNNMNLDTDTVFRLSSNASFRSVGDSGVVLMTDSGLMYSCNSTAEAFLRQTDGSRSLGATADAICAEFDVARDELLADLHEMILYLDSEGVLERVDAAG